MRRWGLAILAAATLIAGQAQACISYSFDPVYAEARIRDGKGVWRDAWIEASGKSIRIEYAHSRTPWGRLVMTGHVTNGTALVFPVATTGSVPEAAKVTWKTSLREGMPEFNLPNSFFEAPFDARVWTNESVDRRTRFNGIPCVFGFVWNGDDVPSGADRSYCVHESGIPVFMKDANGRSIFEVRRLQKRAIPAVRFQAPKAYPLTDKKPKYLEGFTC
ncbi:MAG: hypothetical protein JWR84_3702 [Caulobacter sp.]|nr:hypothetical protein [Caulobacter sp.]